jgi:hypothetical protein
MGLFLKLTKRRSLEAPPLWNDTHLRVAAADYFFSPPPPACPPPPLCEPEACGAECDTAAWAAVGRAVECAATWRGAAAWEAGDVPRP